MGCSYIRGRHGRLSDLGNIHTPPKNSDAPICLDVPIYLDTSICLDAPMYLDVPLYV